MEGSSTEDLLERYYYDNKGGFQSLDKFYKSLRSRGVQIPRKTVQAWLQRLPATAEAARPQKPSAFSSVWADYSSENYQMDTMFLLDREYAGYQYVLLLIDVHSRYLAALPLKDKTAAGYARAIQEMIKDQMDGLYPKRLNCDREYNVGLIKKLMENHNVTMVLSDVGQPYKNAIVERVIRTLRTLLARWTLSDPEGGVDWPSALPELIYNYNHTYHNTLKHTPAEVWEGKEENDQKINWIGKKLKIGDNVRHLLRAVKNNTFSKVDDLLWSKEVYQITEAVGARWRLSETSLDGRVNPKPEAKYMEYELRKAVENEYPRKPSSHILREAQKENAAVKRRLDKEQLGETKVDIGGRPYISREETLPLLQLRVSRPPKRYSPPPINKRPTKRKR